MKLMRLAMCVAVFALVGGIAFSQDMDIRALQAKLAAQEARLNDLQAKMSYASSDTSGGTADNLLSLRKTGKVTIGGDLKVRMYEHIGKIDSKYTAASNGTGAPGNMAKRRDLRANDFRVNDAKLRFKIDVNDYFEAFIRVDLQDDHFDRAGLAQEAYLRWKNVCNSGFSLLVGRTDLVFGGGDEAGVVYTGFYGGTSNESIGELGNLFDTPPSIFANGNGMAPAHTGYDFSRTTQITPSWETQDGSFKAELSYINALDLREQGGGGTRYKRTVNGVERWRSVNDGFGSGSIRLTWKPIEGLKFVASAVNFHNNVAYTNNTAKWRDGYGYVILPGAEGVEGSKNNTAVNLHVAWNPCFLPAFKIWGAWVHDWNAGYVKNLDADMFHAGMSYKFTDKLTAFGIGEFMRHKNKDTNSAFYKSRAWASYVGLQYDIGYGVSTELGWRHEDFKFKNRGGDTHTKAKLDTIYGQLTYLF